MASEPIRWLNDPNIGLELQKLVSTLEAPETLPPSVKEATRGALAATLATATVAAASSASVGGSSGSLATTGSAVGSTAGPGAAGTGAAAASSAATSTGMAATTTGVLTGTAGTVGTAATISGGVPTLLSAGALVKLGALVLLGGSATALVTSSALDDSKKSRSATPSHNTELRQPGLAAHHPTPGAPSPSQETELAPTPERGESVQGVLSLEDLESQVPARSGLRVSPTGSTGRADSRVQPPQSEGGPSELAIEVHLLREARNALPNHLDAALKSLQEYERRFPSGRLHSEYESLLGRTLDASMAESAAPTEAPVAP